MIIEGTQAKEFLNEVASRGIGLYVDMPTGGCIDLDADQVLLFMLNENLFWAKHYGCEVNQFIAWLKARDSGLQCSHKGKRGRRCNNWIPVGERPALFHPGKMKCRKHEGEQ